MALAFTATKLVEVSDVIAAEHVAQHVLAKHAMLSMIIVMLLGVLGVKSVLHCGVQLATMFKI